VGYGGLNIGGGIQRLIDSQQRFVRNSRTDIYVRYRNFTPPQNQLFGQLGFTITPASGPTGTTDVAILPPPETRLISQHNIGMSGGKLRFGAREFIISATFVNAQQSALGLSTPDKLWLSPQFVGLVGYSCLWTVEQIASEELGGIPVIWTLKCNANEQK